MGAEKNRPDLHRFAEQFRPDSGIAYAWGKTARVLTEPFLATALSQTAGDFVLVDLCSSYPIYKQMMIERQRERSRSYITKLTGGFIDELHAPPQKTKFESLRKMSAEDIMRLRKMMAPKGNISRNLLESILLNLVSASSSTVKNEEELTEILDQQFKTSTKGYTMITEPGGKPGDKGTWQFMLPIDTGFSLQEEFVAVFGEEIASSLLKDLSGYFAGKLAGKIRGFQVVSLDIADLKSIVREAERSFPPRYRNTYYFRSARKGDSHVRADVRFLPFTGDTISFISCIEGWPFCGINFTNAEHISTAKQIAHILKPGGRAVLFPWVIQGETEESKKTLQEIESFWAINGLKVEKIQYSLSQLKDDVMSSREYDLVDRSPVFSEGAESFSLIVLEKPKS